MTIIPSGDSPQVVRWISLLVAIIAVGVSITAACCLVRDLWTGTAFHSRGRYDAGEKVTKISSPEKYRESLNKTGLLVLVAAGGSLISFGFYRKLSG